MRLLTVLTCAAYFFASCTRENIDPSPTPPERILSRTVQTHPASGGIMRIAHYNSFGLVTNDTIFHANTGEIGMVHTNAYNSKGKRTRWENIIPVLYGNGVYWALSDFYQDDTLPTVTYRYLKGNQVARIAHSYNASLQLVQDSTYHTPNYGTYTYLTDYTYDVSGRLSSSLDLNNARDTTAYSTYQYSTNRMEKTTLTINHDLFIRGTSLTVTEFNPAGKVISEKVYGGQPYVLTSETNYTYDALGSLLKKTISNSGAAVEEERYTNSPIDGKPEKMEKYSGNQLAYTVTYFYQ